VSLVQARRVPKAAKEKDRQTAVFFFEFPQQFQTFQNSLKIL
jgi:hypothetical protein